MRSRSGSCWTGSGRHAVCASSMSAAVTACWPRGSHWAAHASPVSMPRRTWSPPRAAGRRRRMSRSICSKGDAGDLPFLAGQFDCVVSIATLCFVDEPGRAIRDMDRVLKPGGRLILGELGRWNLWAAQRRVKGWRARSSGAQRISGAVLICLRWPPGRGLPTPRLPEPSSTGHSGGPRGSWRRSIRGSGAGQHELCPNLGDTA